jgi:hypothetical protein
MATTSRAVKTSCKNTKVRSASGSCVSERPTMKKGGTAHPGFKAVQSKIAAKQGISKEAAGAILASSTRKASSKAKAANPRLKRVK